MTDARVAGLQADVALIPTGNTLRVYGLRVDVAYVYSGPAGPSVTVWNGATEIASTATVWNGASEIATTLEVTT